MGVVVVVLVFYFIFLIQLSYESKLSPSVGLLPCLQFSGRWQNSCLEQFVQTGENRCAIILLYTISDQ